MKFFQESTIFGRPNIIEFKGRIPFRNSNLETSLYEYKHYQPFSHCYDGRSTYVLDGTLDTFIKKYRWIILKKE